MTKEQLLQSMLSPEPLFYQVDSGSWVSVYIKKYNDTEVTFRVVGIASPQSAHGIAPYLQSSDFTVPCDPERFAIGVVDANTAVPRINPSEI